MKRLGLFLFALLFSLGVLSVEKVWADAGHHIQSQASHSQSGLVDRGSAEVDVGFSDLRHGNTGDCDGICPPCCAAACGSTALNGATEATIGYLTRVPVQFGMASQRHGRNISPPSPPPRS